MLRKLLPLTVLLCLSGPVLAGKDCEELKTEIAAKLKAKGVAKYSLDAVPAAEVKPADKVVGRCEGGSKRIVYKRG